MSDRLYVPINVSAGLNLVDPVSSLDPGELVRAKNLRAGAWGPRHGNSYIDRANRGRINLGFDGASTQVDIPYIAEQFSLGTSFALDILFYISDLPSSDPAWLWGHDAAANRSVDLYLNTDGSVSAYVEDSTGDHTTLDGVSTHGIGDTVHVRLYRVGTTVRLYVDTVLEASSAEIDEGDVTAVVSGARLIGVPPTYATGEMFNGKLGYVLLRSFGDENFNYAYSELPGPRGGEVLGMWSELASVVGSDDTLIDNSRFGNHGIVTAGSQASRIPELIEPVQGITSVVMRDGRRYNVVMAGGRLYTRVV